MQDSAQGEAYDGSTLQGGAELRGAPRFALMLRSAKLIAEGTEFLCIIRDVSETGVKLRLFHAAPRAEILMIETASGQHYPMQLVWEANGEAGFRFLQPIDVDAFVKESGPYPKRPLRLRVQHPAKVRMGNQSLDATILDISRQGARIAISTKLAIGQKFWLEAEELPLFEATVCWRRVPEYGLVFGQLMGLEELAQRAERMERPERSLAAE
jgi:PilZ domain-containing protein